MDVVDVQCLDASKPTKSCLFWEESTFQHWSLQEGQKFTKVVDTSMVHKRR